MVLSQQGEAGPPRMLFRFGSKKQAARTSESVRVRHVCAKIAARPVRGDQRNETLS